MGNWRWEGLNKDGKRDQGMVQASNEREARKTLRTQGVKVRKLAPPSILEFDIGEWLAENGIGGSIATVDIMRFTKQLSVMLNAGVPIVQSLEILGKSERNPHLKKSVRNMTSDVVEGKTVAEAMKKQNGFDDLYCNLVRAGEAGGILDTILSKLAEFMEKQEKTKKQIKSAMTYPVIVVCVGAGVIGAMLKWVVPTFVGMLSDTGQELPLVTKLVIGASDFLTANFLEIIGGIFFTIVGLSQYVKTDSGKVVADKVAMNMPLFGGIVIKGNLSAFCRTMATLLSSGVTLLDAIEICAKTVPNSIIANDLKMVRKQVEQGKTLTEPLSKIDYFPDMVFQMLQVGEQTGQIDQMLVRVSDVFEDEVNELVGGMTKMIEPFVIVFLGGAVAVILVAMYLPMFMSAGG